jgi:ketosteroid isomerase-like protein
LWPGAEAVKATTLAANPIVREGVRMIRLLSVVAGLGLAVVGLHAQAKTNPELDRLAAAYQAAYNVGDVAKLASFYAEDATSMPPNRPAVQGRTAIVETLRRNLADDPAAMVLIPVESAIVGARAYEVGRRVMTWKSGVVLNEKYTRIYKWEGDEWKIAYFIWNSDSAAGPPR